MISSSSSLSHSHTSRYAKGSGEILWIHLLVYHKWLQIQYHKTIQIYCLKGFLSQVSWVFLLKDSSHWNQGIGWVWNLVWGSRSTYKLIEVVFIQLLEVLRLLSKWQWTTQHCAFYYKIAIYVIYGIYVCIIYIINVYNICHICVYIEREKNKFSLCYIETSQFQKLQLQGKFHHWYWYLCLIDTTSCLYRKSS